MRDKEKVPTLGGGGVCGVLSDKGKYVKDVPPIHGAVVVIKSNQ